MHDPKPESGINHDAIPPPADEQGRKSALSILRAALGRPLTPVPQEELDLLADAALGDTGQSRTCRYLLFLLPGQNDPTGFEGQGLLEMRTLDRALVDAFLTVLNWWRGPTKSDLPLYEVLQRIENAFPREDKE